MGAGPGLGGSSYLTHPSPSTLMDLALGISGTWLGVPIDPWGLSAALNCRWVGKGFSGSLNTSLVGLNERVSVSELGPPHNVLPRMWGVAGVLVRGQVVGSQLSP